jgi:hypothetical protein
MRDSHWIWIIALVLSTGLGSLLCEHFQLPAPVIDIARALFVTSTITATGTALIIGARSAPYPSGPELEWHVRLVSRWVYILLYVLAMARIVLHLLELHEVHAGHGPHHPVEYVRPMDDFRFYIAVCVIPLWSIRALVLGMADRIRHPTRSWRHSFRVR